MTKRDTIATQLLAAMITGQKKNVNVAMVDKAIELADLLMKQLAETPLYYPMGGTDATPATGG